MDAAREADIIMVKEIEIQGCIEVSPETDIDVFINEFIGWVESKGWFFGGGFREMRDGKYADNNGAVRLSDAEKKETQDAY